MKTSTIAAPTTYPGPRCAAPPARARLWTPAVARLRSPAARAAALSVLDQAIVSGTSFASSVLIGRLCSQDDLGVYALALSVLLLSRGVQSEVVSAPYMVYCHRRGGEALARYTGSSLIHQAVITVLTMLAIGGLAAGLAFSRSSPGLVSALFWLMLAVPCILLREHLRQVSFSQLKLAPAVLLDAVVAAIQLGVLGLLAVRGAVNVAAVYLAMGGGCALASLGWFVTRQARCTFDLRAAWCDWWENWSFGRWTLASHLVSRAMTYCAPWLIALTHDEAATGLMAACTTIVNLVGMFVTGVSNYLTPRASRAFAAGGGRALRSVLWETLAVFVATVGGFCVFLAVTDDLLITLVYGTRYAGTGYVLVILSAQLLVNSIGIVAGNGLWAMDCPKANFLADLATLGGTAVTMAALVPPYGVNGAALGLLLGTVAGTLTRATMFHRVLSRQPAEAERPTAEERAL